MGQACAGSGGALDGSEAIRRPNGSRGAKGKGADGRFDARSNSDVVGDPRGDNDLIALGRPHRSRRRKQRSAEDRSWRVWIQIMEIYIIVAGWIERLIDA